MSKSFQRENEMEYLIETLIRMLGKSNERVIDLNKRVDQLEAIFRESIMPDYHPIQPKEGPALFPN
ncbi:hypothetical protein BGM26_19400 [Bacillus sp. FJAT-29790]|uniref:hypothetical protein n=1 Tax=Bacillus sp. FJAT-29790 TaxID=1895002 RepID=UPI001C246A36|nr:hypothetical protein [Bacillus sp. FJAT-29790]MBU8881092.1 hypothetical protein [Bacillus sp. FJAT-29790]